MRSDSRKHSTAPWMGLTEVASITPSSSEGRKNVVQPVSLGISEFRYTSRVYLDQSGSDAADELNVSQEQLRVRGHTHVGTRQSFRRVQRQAKRRRYGAKSSARSPGHTGQGRLTRYTWFSLYSYTRNLALIPRTLPPPFPSTVFGAWAGTKGTICE